MKDIVILGAGITGMSIALELRKKQETKDCNILILEKEDHPGGLLYGTDIDGHNFNNGCYATHSNSTIVIHYPELFEKADFNWKIWLNHNYTRYPPSYQTLTANRGIGYKLSLLAGILAGRIASIWHKPQNAKEWMDQNLGKSTVSSTHLETYLEKLQGLEAVSIDVTLCNTRLKELRQPLWQMFRKQFLDSIIKSRKPGLPTYICYPSGGTIQIARYLYSLCLQAGIDFKFQASVQTIDRLSDSYRVLESDREFTADILFSTIPLTELLTMLSENPELSRFPVPEYTTLYVLMLLVKKMSLPGDYVVLYSFEKEHLWKRVFGVRQSDGLMAVIVEVNLLEQLTDNKIKHLLDETTDQLINEVRLFKAEDVLFSSFKTIPYAYPSYQMETYDQVMELQRYISSHYGIRLFGRQGRFAYLSSSQVLEQVLDSMREQNFSAEREPGI